MSYENGDFLEGIPGRYRRFFQNIPSEEAIELREQFERVVNENPEDAALVFAWISERRGKPTTHCSGHYKQDEPKKGGKSNIKGGW